MKAILLVAVGFLKKVTFMRLLGCALIVTGAAFIGLMVNNIIGCAMSPPTPQEEYCQNAPITITWERAGGAPWRYKTYGPYATEENWVRFKDCSGDSIVISGSVVVIDHRPKPFSTPHRMFRNEDDPDPTSPTAVPSHLGDLR
jgi:hypothetical protein